MRKISIVLGCTSILSIALLICTAFNIEPAYAEKGEFQYHQKPVKKIKEKNLKVRIAISRFEDSVDIDGSPFNVPKDAQKPDKSDDSNKDIDITIRTDKQQDEDKTIPKKELLTGLLTDSLQDTNMFDIVERSEINQLIKEVNFQNSDWTEDQSINTLGNIYGVQYIVTADILRNRYGDNIAKEPYTISLRMYNLNTGEIASSSVTSSTYIKEAVARAAKDIANKIQTKPWTCRVVGVSDEGVYINAGLKDNLEKDDIFYVYRLGSKITDPETGQVLGSEKKKIALLKISEVLNDSLSRANVIENYDDLIIIEDDKTSTEIEEYVDKVVIGDIVYAKQSKKAKEAELAKWKEKYGEKKTLKEISSEELVNYSGSAYLPETIMANIGIAVVMIQADNSIGSGFVISSDGYIVTNFHVVKDSKFVNVKMIEENKYISNVSVVKVNPARDLALLKAETNKGLPAVILGNSDNIRIGEQVVAIGNPEGLENTISDGLVSGIRETDGMKFIQTSVPVTGGSSGGPLVNMQGEVIGVISSGLPKEGNINFAVPINYVKDEML
ncbi:MAG: trypsin-like peptidase domain-containing protein [Candidatus Orphnella occulta]|nr:trypsin-like peptidase domain-containing protein [Candidatus Orphnella occulta]